MLQSRSRDYYGLRFEYSDAMPAEEPFRSCRRVTTLMPDGNKIYKSFPNVNYKASKNKNG